MKSKKLLRNIVDRHVFNLANADLFELAGGGDAYQYPDEIRLPCEQARALLLIAAIDYLGMDPEDVTDYMNTSMIDDDIAIASKSLMRIVRELTETIARVQDQDPDGDSPAFRFCLLIEEIIRKVKSVIAELDKQTATQALAAGGTDNATA